MSEGIIKVSASYSYMGSEVQGLALEQCRQRVVNLAAM
jgi:hypothetical protein